MVGARSIFTLGFSQLSVYQQSVDGDASFCRHGTGVCYSSQSPFEWSQSSGASKAGGSGKTFFQNAEPPSKNVTHGSTSTAKFNIIQIKIQTLVMFTLRLSFIQCWIVDPIIEIIRNLNNHKYPDTSGLKKLSRLITYFYCIPIPDLYLNCHKGEPASFQSKCRACHHGWKLSLPIPHKNTVNLMGVVIMDSKLKNNREIKCPPFFIQGDDVIYDYLIQDCFHENEHTTT